MNSVERTIAAEMARPIHARLCAMGCGLPVHRGHCKGEDRFAAEDGIRKCAKCQNKLANSNPGPLCRTCQAKVLQQGIAQREHQAVGAERLEKPRGYVPGPRPAVAEIPKPAAATRRPGVCTIRIDAIPESAENRLESGMGELYGRLTALEDGEALVIPCEGKRQIRNTCERLRNRLKNAKAGRLRWKRDELTLYVWREPLHGAGDASRERAAK